MIYQVNNHLRCTILMDGTAEARLADSFQPVDGRTFSRRVSESIVGGHGQLRRLVREQKVRVTKKPCGRNYYNASDVLRYAVVKPT